MIRFKVTGEKDSIPVGTSFKTKSAAIKYADTLSNSEVYDMQTREYIHGTSKFMQMLKQKKEADNVNASNS